MIRLRSLARSTSWRLSASAAACFLLLSGAFGTGLLGGPLWNGARWIDAPLLTYLLAGGIVTAGLLPVPRRTKTDGERGWALLGLAVRLFVGRMWLSAGLSKLGNPAWTTSGQALHGFWHSAIAVDAKGHGPITYAWYRTFLQFMDGQQWYGWFAKLIVGGELVVGLALLVGGLVGFAAVGGVLLNLNYGWAGAASANPLLLLLGLLLAVGWRTAGYWGLDRWLLPRISAPANRDAVAAPARPPQQRAGLATPRPRPGWLSQV